MNDQTRWVRAVAAAGATYGGMPASRRAELDSLLTEIMLLKQELVELALSAGSSGVCRSCGGECCLRGKYHFSVLDVLAYLKHGVDPVAPDFSTTPFCPYSDASGCLMSPRYRPVTCVIFNCQQIEERMTPTGREQVRQHESRLRAAVNRAAHISPDRFDRPLLLSCD